MSPVDVVNSLIGKPYRAGAMGPDAFDCYGLARHLQRELWNRDMPLFHMPGEASRYTIASAIAAHPERDRWREVQAPEDGAIAVMSRQDCGYHMGVFVALDGGLVVHAMEGVGVVAESPFRLSGPAGRWRLKWMVPVE